MTESELPQKAEDPNEQEATEFVSALNNLRVLIASVASTSLQNEEPRDELIRKIKELRLRIKVMDIRTGLLLADLEPRKVYGKIYDLVRPEPASRYTALEKLREFSQGAEKLIICDPYFYGGEAASSRNYIDEIVKASRIKAKQLTRVHVIFSSKGGQTKKIIRDFKQACSDNRIFYTEADTDIVHDRFWIKDDISGLIIGTSLGGLGNRLSFISEMGKYDLVQLLDYLRNENLLG